MASVERVINKALPVFTIITLLFIAVYGFAIVVNEIKPFWLDEWSIIQNLKFRPAADLWGTLENTQQFPRTYLQIINFFSHRFDYSYTSLRLPAYVVHVVALVGCYRLSTHIFKNNVTQMCFWVLAYASSKTALEYFVQIKHYTMEMALALAVFWQLKELLQISEGKRMATGPYLFLCATFIVFPFFSYCYPIALLPVYFIIGSKPFIPGQGKKKWQWKTIIPLLCGAISIMIFYFIEVRNVVQDGGMKQYWHEYMVASSFPLRIYQLFANMGAGDLFETIYGILGITALAYATYCAITRKSKTFTPYVLYSVLLVWTTVLLFFMGKLPLGAHRLNAYALPATALLILFLLGELSLWSSKWATGVNIATTVFCIAFIGNAVATLLNDISDEEHQKKLHIYEQTAKVINQANNNAQAIAVTSAIAYPYQDMMTGGWVLKTHPAYKSTSTLPVYSIPVNANVDSFMNALTADINNVLYFNADTFYTYPKN